MQDSAQILQRLERLERSNRRWKKAGSLLALGLIGALSMGFARPSEGTLKGSSLELSDPAGEVYASIKLDDKGFPLLHMTKGKSYAIVSLQGPVIHLRAEDNTRTAYLGIDSVGNSKLELTANSHLDGARITVKPNGTTGYYARDAEGYDRFGLESTAEGLTSLNLYGARRSLRSSMALDDKGNASQLILDGNGRRRVGMSVLADGVPQITLTDDKERPRLNMTMGWDGSSKVEFLRADGQVGVEHP